MHTAKEDQTNKRFKEAQGGAKLFLRTVGLTVSGAGVLRFLNTPIMCLRVGYLMTSTLNLGEKCLDNIDAVFGLNREIRDSFRSLVRNLL